MVLLPWSEIYSVGVPLMDDQHRRWFQLFNMLHQAMVDGKAADIVGAVLKDAADYTRTHFAEEERLLKQSGYPLFLAHKTAHDRFVQQLQDKLSGHTAGDLTLTLEAMRLLRDWLVQHIQTMDQQYAAFLREGGPR